MSTPALAPRPGGTSPGLHPGHPTAVEGCRPASRGLSLTLVTYGNGRSRDHILGGPSLNLDSGAAVSLIRGALGPTGSHRIDRSGTVPAYRGTVSTLQLTIDPKAATAPFEQVRTQIAAAVAEGRLDAGTRLPTVRQLAADLGLAANTVARAYRELEADSVIATHGRGGTFVRSEVVDEPTTHSSAADAARVAANDYVHSVRRLGLSAPEALRLVENAWNKS